MSLNDLQNRLRAERTNLPETLAIRLHRAVSWLRCGDAQHDDDDLRFISLWIAFNACYGVDEERPQHLGERDVFQRFTYKLVRHDSDEQIYHCLWQTYSGPVRLLITNRYVYAPFWEAQRLVANGKPDTTDWAMRFDKSSKKALQALAQQNVPELLGVVLDRLYVLRNQLMHGGATWQSKVNRQQVKDGCNILATLMPVIVEIMLAAKNEEWGEIFYPVVK